MILCFLCWNILDFWWFSFKIFNLLQQSFPKFCDCMDFSQKRGGSVQCYFDDFCAVAKVTSMPNFIASANVWFFFHPFYLSTREFSSGRLRSTNSKQLERHMKSLPWSRWQVVLWSSPQRPPHRSSLGCHAWTPQLHLLQ